jgi:hypothetical protein
MGDDDQLNRPVHDLTVLDVFQPHLGAVPAVDDDFLLPNVDDGGIPSADIEEMDCEADLTSRRGRDDGRQSLRPRLADESFTSIGQPNLIPTRHREEEGRSVALLKLPDYRSFCRWTLADVDVVHHAVGWGNVVGCGRASAHQ